MSTIYCFSATGNSLYLAQNISNDINAKLLPITNHISVCDDKVIGFVFPVYYWGVPAIVERFVANLKITCNNPYIFLVITYGGMAYGVEGVFNNLLNTKGLNLSYSAKIKTVKNYIPSFKVNDENFNWNIVDIQLKEVSKDIKFHIKNKTSSSTVLNKVMNKFFPYYKGNCDKYFTVSDKCNACGACEKLCPVDNIKISNKKVEFLGECEHCLACINACPTEAIDWKNKTIGKRRYKNSKVKIYELIKFRDKKETTADE